MRSILLSAFAAAVALTASANEISVRPTGTLPETLPPMANAKTFKEKYHLDQPLPLSSQRELTNKNLPAHRAQANLSESELVTDPQGTKSRYAMTANIYLSHMGNAHVGGFGADVIISEDGTTFYSKAFTLNFFQQGYSAGNIEGDKVVFPAGQYIYDTEDGEKAYMYSAYLEEGEEWPELVDTFILTKNEQGEYVSENGYYFMVMTEEAAEEGINESTDIICFGTDYVFTPLPTDLTENTLPTDAEVFECQMMTNSLSDYGDTLIKEVTVGVSGDHIYIGGLTSYLPGSYLMGTKTSDNTFTFNSHQYLGYYDEGDYPYIYEFTMVNPIYFDGESFYYNEVESVTMTFDEEHTMLTLEKDAGIFICSYGDLSSWDEVYWNTVIADFNQALTPKDPTRVECFNGYGTPYLAFEWSKLSVEGLPMNGDKLWCEIIVNGEPYEFSPEYYTGLTETTDRVYYNTSGVEGIYPSEYTTIYLSKYNGKFNKIKSIGIKIGYEGNNEIRYTDLVYAKDFEPIEDKAVVPSTPTDLIYYQEYYHKIRFTFNNTDIEGNLIPERLLAMEILLDGEPLVFKDSDYYFNGGEGPDMTLLDLSNGYGTTLLSRFGNDYLLSLWGHDEIPEFKTISVRMVCTGGDTLTYGESYEIDLERAATPANPWDVTYNEESKEFSFGALPIDTNNDGLAPGNYGYEVYVNDELFVFNADLYELGNNITLIPYEGFEYNYNFYLHTDYVYDETTWTLTDQKVVMTISMGNQEDISIQKIGVRAVYTDGEGNTTYSEIINSDGTTGSTSGINAISNDNQSVKWYNLQGVEVVNPEPGSVYLRQQGGKTTKVFVK